MLGNSFWFDTKVSLNSCLTLISFFQIPIYTNWTWKTAFNGCGFAAAPSHLYVSGQPQWAGSRFFGEFIHWSSFSIISI